MDSDAPVGSVFFLVYQSANFVHRSRSSRRRQMPTLLLESGRRRSQLRNYGYRKVRLLSLVTHLVQRGLTQVRFRYLRTGVAVYDEN
jgi:hypothetical protein